MTQSSPLSKMISFAVLFSLLVTGCSGAPAASVKTTDQNVEQSFFTNLSELQTKYGFSAIEEIDLSDYVGAMLVDEGAAWQAVESEIQFMDKLSIKNKEGLFVEFTFSHSLADVSNMFYFVLQPDVENEPVMQSFLSMDGLTVLNDGLPSGSGTFQDALDAQPEAHYAMFIYRTEAGGLEARLWNTTQPENTALLIAEQDLFSDNVAKFGIKLTGDQTLTIHTLWKTVFAADTKAPTQTDVSVSVDELGGYSVNDSSVVNSLDCEGQSAGEDGIFLWDEITNKHCDLSIKMREALSFDFVLANPANDWSRIAIVMLDANLEGSDMPIKNLGITLANDRAILKMDYDEIASIEYSDGFELDAGISYSATIIMNDHNGIEISVWPVDDPDMSMGIILNDENVPPDWLPVEHEEWVFGMWIPNEQQITISNMVHYTLGNTVSDQANEKDSVVDNSENQLEIQQAEWVETGIIPNLGEFYIPELTSYQDIICDNDSVYPDGLIDLPAAAENHTHECQTDIPEGFGLIFEFVYAGKSSDQQDKHLLDLAFSVGEGEAQKVIRYLPGSNEIIMKDSGDQFKDFPVQGELVLEAGKRYTMVFVSLYNKYLYIWPSDEPEKSISAIIDVKDWEALFGPIDPEGKWQLRLWKAAGLNLTLQNLTRFEVN